MMETSEILEQLTDLAGGHDEGGIAYLAHAAAERIRELRDQLAEAEARAQKVREIA